MSGGPAAAPEPETTVLHGGRVITLGRGAPAAQALAVREGRVVAVGDSATVLAGAPPGSRRLDLRGRCVLPGFVDAHPHVDREGLRARGGIPIAGLTSVAEIVDTVRRAAASTPPGAWIVLMPMGAPPHDYVRLPEDLREGRFPTRQDLDAAAPQHPVYIRAVWGWWSRPPFPSVASSLALLRAGITRETTPPPNVEIVRDARGEPTGVFLERNYVPVLEYTLFRCLPRFTQEDRVESVRRGARAYAALGTTAAFEGHGLTPALIRAYREVHAREGLPLRLHTPVSVPSAAFDDARLADLLYHWAALAGGGGCGDEVLRVEGLNLGGLGDPEVAEIVATGYPYEQWAGHFHQALDHGRLVRLALEAARLGLRVSCVVSRDLEYGLSAYEAVDREVPIRDRRWVLVHVNQATADQLRRMRRLGVIATVTPGFLHWAGDRYGLDRLGERAIPIREMLHAGVPVALGTDGVPPSMLWTLWETLARWDAGSGRAVGQSRLTREEALRLAVQTGHLLTWSEHRRGRLEPGRDADLVVLDGDPLTCPEDALRLLGVDLTMVGGRVVHAREGAWDA